MRSSISNDGHSPDSQRKLALKAMNRALSDDKAYKGNAFSTNYTTELINVLQNRKYTTEEQMKISIINAKHALYEMLYRITTYKDNLTFQESLGNMELGDIITIRNELNECEQQINSFLDTLEEDNRTIKATSEEQRHEAEISYKVLIDSIDLMLHTVYEKYEPLLQQAEYILPLS